MMNEMFTHMHYRVLGVGSLRIQGPVEREYLNNSGQAGQSGRKTYFIQNIDQRTV